MSIDEYTLAAFLSGELPERERKSVAAALVFDEDAREILHMACEALAAAFGSDATRTDFTERIRTRPAKPGLAETDRPARYGPSRRVA